MLKTDVITCEKIRKFILLFEGNYRKYQPEHTVAESLTGHIAHIILWFIHKPQIPVSLNVTGFFATCFHKPLLYFMLRQNSILILRRARHRERNCIPGKSQSWRI